MTNGEMMYYWNNNPKIMALFLLVMFMCVLCAKRILGLS